MVPLLVGAAAVAAAVAFAAEENVVPDYHIRHPFLVQLRFSALKFASGFPAAFEAFLIYLVALTYLLSLLIEGVDPFVF